MSESPGFFSSLLGKIFNRGTELELKGGLDFQSPLSATPNSSSGLIDINVEIADLNAFPEIIPISASTLTLDRAVHLGKILKCTHASGCAITVPDDEFQANDWVQAYGTLAVVTFVEGGTMAIEPSLASRAVNVRVELLFSAAAVAILNGDIQL